MLLLKSLIVVLISSKFSDCFELEPVDFVDVESFDGIRSYPVLKVSYMPKGIKTIVNSKGELNSNKINKNIKTSSSKSSLVDNVREFEPMSREDIRKLKKLSFHGRSSPTAPLNASNIDGSTQNALQQLPVHHVNYRERKYIQQQSNNERKPQKKKEISSKSYSSYEDKGFQPLMRPSPINVHPVDQPSFHTTRNYVDYLKLRQKQFFEDLLKDDPISDEERHDEVGYFIKRERELAEEQRPKFEHKSVEDDDAYVGLEAKQSVKEESDIDDHDYDSREEEESRRHESFVPFRLYAQVRHVEADHHEPRSKASSPKAKEKLTLEKKNVFYKEEGYEEKDYDHGAEKISAKYRHRSKRDVIEAAPTALPIIIKSSSPQLTGEKILRQLNEHLKKSSLFLPDDDDDVVETKQRPSETIYGTSGKNYKSHKYPYYNLPDTNTLNTMSAFRYSENMKNFPQAKQSLYSFKNLRECQEIDPNINPVPADIEEEGKKTKFNESPQRLKNLGDKIGCFKEKYFGKDPFDNPLFKEKYVSTSIPISTKDSSFLSHQANPLITVYDDVISNIRAAFADELKKQREQESLASESVSVSQTTPKAPKPEVKITSLSSAPAVSRLPLFDINHYYPKLSVSKQEEIPSTSNQHQTKNEFEIDFIEIPITERTKTNYKNKLPNAPKKVGSIVIKNLRPPNLALETRRRRNPIANNKAFQLPRSQLPSHYLQPPTTPKNKFKLL